MDVSHQKKIRDFYEVKLPDTEFVAVSSHTGTVMLRKATGTDITVRSPFEGCVVKLTADASLQDIEKAVGFIEKYHFGVMYDHAKDTLSALGFSQNEDDLENDLHRKVFVSNKSGVRLVLHVSDGKLRTTEYARFYKCGDLKVSISNPKSLDQLIAAVDLLDAISATTSKVGKEV